MECPGRSVRSLVVVSTVVTLAMVTVVALAPPLALAAPETCKIDAEHTHRCQSEPPGFQQGLRTVQQVRGCDRAGSGRPPQGLG